MTPRLAQTEAGDCTRKQGDDQGNDQGYGPDYDHGYGSGYGSGSSKLWFDCTIQRLKHLVWRGAGQLQKWARAEVAIHGRRYG
jgi:hypothetical protein